MVGGFAKNIHPVWEEGGESLRQVFGKVGGELLWNNPQIEDVAKQREIFEGYLAQGVDGICFAASDPDAFTDLVGEATSRGIPVGMWEADAAPSGRLVYVGGNDYAYGHKAGKMLAEKIGGEGQVAIMQGSATATNARLRSDGMEDACTEAGCEVVARDIDKEDVEVALSHAEQMLATYPDLKGFLGVYAYHIESAGVAVINAGKEGEIAISGTDPYGKAWDFIRDGICFGAYTHEFFQMSQTLAVFMVNMLTFGPAMAYAVSQIDPALPTADRKLFVKDILLTPENVDEYLAHHEELVAGDWGFDVEPLE